MISSQSIGRPLAIVMLPTGLDRLPSVCQTGEPILVETGIPETGVETFHKGILGRLSRIDKSQPHAGSFQPQEHGLAGSFRTVIDHHLRRQGRATVQEERQRKTGNGEIHDLSFALSGAVIDDMEHSKP